MTSRNIDDLIYQYMLAIISQQDTIMQTLRNIQDINNNMSSIFLGYLNDRRLERNIQNNVEQQPPSRTGTTSSYLNNSFANRNRPPLDSELPPRTRRNNFFPNIPFSNSTSYSTNTPVTPFSFGLDTNTNSTSSSGTTSTNTLSGRGTSNLQSISEEEGEIFTNTNDTSETSGTLSNRENSMDDLPTHTSTAGASTSSGLISTSTSNDNTRGAGHSLRGLRNTILSSPGANNILGRRSRSERNGSSIRNRSSVYNDVDDVLRQPLERRRNRFHTRIRARNTTNSQTSRQQWLNIPTVSINNSIGDIGQNILNATMNDSPVRIIASRRQIARATRVVRFSEIESTEERNTNENTSSENTSSENTSNENTSNENTSSENNQENETICPIDRDILRPEDYVMQIIHCGHFFREENLRTHFRRNPRCPLCRFDIRDYGISNEELNNRQTNNTASRTTQGTQTRPTYPPPPPPNTNIPPIASNIIRESINNTLGNLYSSVGSLYDIENPFLTRPSSNINPTRQTTSEINGNTITHTRSFTSGTNVPGNNTVLEYSITIQPFSNARTSVTMSTPSATTNASTSTNASTTTNASTSTNTTDPQDAENVTTDDSISEAETVEGNSSHENTPSPSDDELHELHQHTD